VSGTGAPVGSHHREAVLRGTFAGVLDGDAAVTSARAGVVTSMQAFVMRDGRL
jgi:hypothetical protein